VFDSVHEVCRIPAGAGGIRHSVALAIKYYPVIFITVTPHPKPPQDIGATVYTQVLFKIKSAVRNCNYTGKTHLRGLKISIFS